MKCYKILLSIIDVVLSSSLVYIAYKEYQNAQ